MAVQHEERDAPRAESAARRPRPAWRSYGPNVLRPAASAARPAVPLPVRQPAGPPAARRDAISALTGDVESFVIITAIVVLSVTLDFVQEHRAGRAAERLKASVAVRATVVRDGGRARSRRELVPGDACSSRPAISSPPTAASLEARDFFVNQALLTGEPYPVEKHARRDGDAQRRT